MINAISLQRSFNISKNEFIIFCYDGEKSWSRIWSNLEFVVSSKAKEFTLNIGENASVLMDQLNAYSLTEVLGLWATSYRDTYQKNIIVSPYGTGCVGVSYHGSSREVKFAVVLKETGKYLSLIIIEELVTN